MFVSLIINFDSSPPFRHFLFVRGPLTLNPIRPQLPSFAFLSIFVTVPRLGSDTARKNPTSLAVRHPNSVWSAALAMTTNFLSVS